MAFSKDHNQGKEEYLMGERGLSEAIQNWRNAAKHGTEEARAKYALSVLAHLGDRARKLNDLVAEGTLTSGEADAIRRDSLNI